MMIKVCFLTIVHMTAMEDWKYRRIPNRYWQYIVLLAMGNVLAFEGKEWFSYLAGGLSIGLVLLMLALLWPGGLGGGDVKWMASCGLFLGMKQIWEVFCISVFLACAYGLGCMLAEGTDWDRKIPMGPFFEAGILYVFLRGL